MLSTGHKGSNVREVPPQLFIDTLAKHFETTRLFSIPEWTDLIKTGSLKQMPPNFTNWYYTRTASIVRQVYLHPGTSVESLRNYYGKNVDSGFTPNHHGKASGKVIRSCLQDLEKIGWIKQSEDKIGRMITDKGQKQLDILAQEVAKSIKQ